MQTCTRSINRSLLSQTELEQEETLSSLNIAAIHLGSFVHRHLQQQKTPKMASSPPALSVHTPTPSSPATSTNVASPAVGTGDLLALPPAVLHDSANGAPSQIQSARGAGPSLTQTISMRSDDLATTTSAAHRRAVTQGSPADFDWPPPQPVRGVSSSSSNGFSSASPVPLLHELPPNECIYMQGLLTKKGRNLGFWHWILENDQVVHLDRYCTLVHG